MRKERVPQLYTRLTFTTHIVSLQQPILGLDYYLGLGGVYQLKKATEIS
jgi:hypothetical protein